MIVLALTLLALTAALALVLSRFVPTRTIGIGAAVLMLAAAVLLFSRPAPSLLHGLATKKPASSLPCASTSQLPR
ncbi:MAG: hypothetical protein HC893_02415 [Chloroflexaceae bacterium]|nr:hypothetical protein [Chloroflexaceae bacterium]NJL32900.1 hypothetical protein [Chloroflexaceae bacterium]NJO07540.1 hypothetical protein [Chloroflexaceae bacterium]